MSDQPINPTEFGMHGLCPHIVCKGAGDAMDWYAKAHAAGATIVMPMADIFWGDRYGMIEDPFGHRWSIATSKGPPVTGDALTQAMHAAIEGV